VSLGDITSGPVRYATGANAPRPVTAVDVDALDAARAAATPGEWHQDGTHVARGSRWTHDTSALAPTGSVEDAALIVAAVNALPDLLAEVRRGRALREAVEGLAAVEERHGRPGSAARLRAALTAVDEQ